MLLFVKKLFGKRSKVHTQRHSHGALVHDHEHFHVTHNRTDPGKGVGGWEHLTANHSHSHNHASMDHVHRPHRNFDVEHHQEAHVHDHDHPASEG
jgi:hypothetical protein